MKQSRIARPIVAVESPPDRAARRRVCRGARRRAVPSGVEAPTRAPLARLDRKRPEKGRSAAWRHPHDPDARIPKMKNGRTPLAHKADPWRC